MKVGYLDRSVVVAAIALMISATVPATATPIQWTEAMGGNGHWYEFVDFSEDLTWYEAEIECVSQGGYLATITSQEESEFISNLVLPNTTEAEFSWIGGWQDHGDPGYSEPGGGWQWTTNEIWSFTNWRSPDPNNVSPGEDHLSIYSWDGAHAYHGKWADLPWDRANVQGFICEIPEPGTLSLLLFGGLALFAGGRRCRQHD